MASPFASTDRSGPVLARTATPDDSDAYGTFHASQAPTTAATPSTRRKTSLLRAAGLTGALLLTAAACFSASTRPPVTVTVSVASDAAMQTDTALRTETVESVGAVALAADATDAVEAVSKLSAVEQAYVEGVDAAHMREFLHAYSSTPHISGSKGDYETALYTLRQFEAFGLEAEIVEYYTLLSLPVSRRLAIVEPASAARELNLTEASVPGDACTTNPDAQPPFLAYSPSGRVVAPVVYVNYGTQADFALLARRNVSLAGKIALMRYGGNYRGLKVLAALEHGMAAALIYSDPQDDGFVRGPVYPEGPWRPEDSFQRGSISNDCGDPLTPGYASVLGSEHLAYESTANTSIPKIPSLPLSYGQAKHILGALSGSRAPADWQGGLAFPGGYRVGDDSATVLDLDLVMDNKVGPIWDVVATIPGAIEPDRQVLLGNHRDGWVCGAIDPNSGSSTMLEVARGFGNLLKAGWRPRRTIKLASWDAEEQGLLGSTEYAEQFAESLATEAVAYLNVDAMLGSIIGASGSPSIAKLMFAVADSIPANTFGGVTPEEKTLYEQWVNQAAARNSSLGTIGPDHMMGVLGTGSDFGAYTHHLGIVSSDISFALTAGPYGTYHSTMDSVMYSEMFADPEYATHVVTANWWGLMALRLADSAVLPFDFSTYHVVMADAISAFEPQLAANGLTIDFSGLRGAIASFQRSAEAFHAELKAFQARSSAPSELELAKWNNKIAFLERHLLLEAGLPHRGWYKHVVFGPGFYDGYGGTAFPGLADAIAFKDDAAATQKHVEDVARVVQGAAEFLFA